MRVWDIDVSRLCNKHLVAQHHEIHTIASVVSKIHGGEKPGYSNHPEVLRWMHVQFQTLALVKIHDITVAEMLHRGMKHNDSNNAVHVWLPGVEPIPIPEPWQPVSKQVEILRSKGCGCNTEGL